MSDDLKTLFPGEVVEVAGEQITVHPFYFGQLSRVVKFCKPIVDALISSGIMTIQRNEKEQTSTIKIDPDFIPKAFQIMADGGEPLMGLIAFSVNKDRTWLDTKVTPDEGILLAQKIYEVNANFFVARVLPILAGKLSNFVSIGATSSQGSSEQDIAVKT